jgi:hypothetical protein
LQDEIQEWEEASLTDLQDWEDKTIEWDDYSNPSPVIYDEFDLNKDGVLNPEEQKRKEIDQKLDEIDALQNQPMDFLNMQRQLSAKYEELRKLKQELDELRNSEDDVITYN